MVWWYWCQIRDKFTVKYLAINNCVVQSSVHVWLFRSYWLVIVFISAVVTIIVKYWLLIVLLYLKLNKVCTKLLSKSKFQRWNFQATKILKDTMKVHWSVFMPKLLPLKLFRPLPFCFDGAQSSNWTQSINLQKIPFPWLSVKIYKQKLKQFEFLLFMNL